MPSSNTGPIAQLGLHRLVPVVAIRDAAASGQLAEALVAGGLPLIEITLRTDAAPAALKRAAAVKDLLVIAGTVTSVEKVKMSMDCGAQAIVSPGFSRPVVEYCLAHEIPVLPGVCTPTEIEMARDVGLSTLKFFPAEAYGGARTLAALADVYKDFRFVPTGGVILRNLADYLKVPIVLACGGSWMAPTEAIEYGRFDEIVKLVSDAVAFVKALPMSHVALTS